MQTNESAPLFNNTSCVSPMPLLKTCAHIQIARIFYAWFKRSWLSSATLRINVKLA